MESFSVSSEIAMTAVDQNIITELALEQMSPTPDPRYKQIPKK